MDRQSTTDRRTFVKGLAAGVAATTLGTGVTGASAAPGSYSTEDLRIASWDGTELAATLFVPEGTGPFPSMLMTHGWGGDRQDGTSGRLAPFYAENGYVVLAYDSRGFGESDGEVGIDGPKEVRDARALISFLADHDAVANDGPDDPKVGMDGVSYAAGIQLNTAARDDRLDAIVPRWAWTDLTHSLAPNGVVKAGWASLLFGVGITGARGLTSGDDTPNQRDVEAGATPRLSEAYATSTVRNGFTDQSRAYYKVRSPAAGKFDDIADAGAPALFVSAWNDTLFTPNEALRNFRAMRERGLETDLVLFQGAHTFGETPDAETQARLDGMALEWIDEHVAGSDEAGLPPVTYYRTQTDTFHSVDRLPTTADEALTLSFADAAGEGSTPVGNAVAPTSVSQLAPGQAGDYAAPATAASFDFPVEEDTELLGVPELTLGVEPLGTETRLFVKLVHVSDAGETVVHNQVTPLKVTGAPGTVSEVTLDMVATQRHLAAGDTLRVVVATSDAGFYSSRTSAGALLHHGPSSVEIPVADGSDSVGGGGGDGENGDGDENGSADPTVSVTRSDDGTVFTGGQTNQVTLTVDATRPVRVRDRTPAGWVVTGGDRHDRTAPPETDGNYTEFVVPVESGERTYFARAPSGPEESGPATFGPVEYSTDGGRTWTVVAGTTDDNVLVGAEGP